jgi:hypothetical protein
MSDVLMVMIVMLVSFFIGAAGMLLFGGKTALNYLKVKMSKGKKVLMMVKTPFGWKSYVASKDQNLLIWKYDDKEMMTDISETSIRRYMAVSFVFVDVAKPNVAIEMSEGRFYPADFDPQVFNNILIRALTKPNSKATNMLKNLMIIAIFGIIICIIIGAVIIQKIGGLTVTGII